MLLPEGSVFVWAAGLAGREPCVERFRDRRDAGRLLAARLQDYAGRDDVVVLGLPRGGVPVAAEVARVLRAPLDVFVVRKLGVPGQEELAMGAIAFGEVRVLNDDVIAQAGLTEEDVARAAAAERRELIDQDLRFRGDRAAPEVAGKTVVLVDDGLATGATMRAAVAATRAQGATRVVVAVPAAARRAAELLREESDELVCLTTPEPFRGVGRWYEDFTPTTDEEVRVLLAEARGHR